MLNYKVLTLTAQLGPADLAVHPVIFFDGRDLVLCDSGYPGQADQIEAALGGAGFSLGELTKVVITHQDHDHLGSLAELKRRNPRLQVLASPIEAPYISGALPSLRLLQAEAHNKTLAGAELEFGLAFASYLKTIEACPVDALLEDRAEVLPGLWALATPGHAPGHLSLYLEAQGLLVAGDALALEEGKLSLANPQFTMDLGQALDSVRRIRELEPRMIVCYHGGRMDGNIEAGLKSLLAGMA